MAFLEQFSEEERELIISVPYRAGLWVCTADETGGAKAHAEERQKLAAIIAEKARGMFDSAFVHEVMAEISTRDKDRDAWGAASGRVLDDCSKAVSLIQARLTEKDVDAYRSHIMSIGVEVAKAYREFDEGVSILSRLCSRVHLFTEGVVRLLKRDNSYSSASVLNISFEEDMALAELSKALQTGVDERGGEE